MQNARTTYLTILLIVGLSDGDRFPGKLQMNQKLRLNFPPVLCGYSINMKHKNPVTKFHKNFIHGKFNFSGLKEHTEKRSLHIYFIL